MSYSINPSLPKIRQQAADLVRRGWSARKVGRYLGFHHTAVMKWVKKARQFGYHPIRTKSSRPQTHPKQLSDEVVWQIFQKRIQTGRCSEVVYEELKREGVKVSLSSVKRTLNRTGLINKKSPWKRYHTHVDRPEALKPGDLVEMDTIHLMIGPKKRIYVFVLIDVYSRWVYAKVCKRMSSAVSVRFLREAEIQSNFTFTTIQTDHGPEFGRWFVEQIKKKHRYTRIGKPNDNAHIERVNRTLQEECLDKHTVNVFTLNEALKKYLPYYNQRRLHMGINYKTPQEMVPRY